MTMFIPLYHAMSFVYQLFILFNTYKSKSFKLSVFSPVRFTYYYTTTSRPLNSIQHHSFLACWMRMIQRKITESLTEIKTDYASKYLITLSYEELVWYVLLFSKLGHCFLITYIFLMTANYCLMICSSSPNTKVKTRIQLFCLPMFFLPNHPY